MRYVKWGFLTVLSLLIFSFFHYTLPQHDIVRITNTEVRRIDFGENSIFWASPDVGTSATGANRDVRFIEAFYPNGKPMVYRNEDTGWGWPPYFKLDSSNLQAQARDLVSNIDNPKWVSVTHYGWRNEFLTIYPNAVGVKPIAGPDVRIIPWVNMIILLMLALLLFMLWRMWQQFWERTIDPVLDDIDEASDAATDKARSLWSRIRRR
ncbi:MAG: DUF1523 family protein [Paracoccaceae bacterium]|nr:DUF1523 family protein [Paracoccaceae bacterium]